MPAVCPSGVYVGMFGTFRTRGHAGGSYNSNANVGNDGGKFKPISFWFDVCVCGQADGSATAWRTFCKFTF